MPDPTGRISHLPDMHRGVAWKEPVRVATASNIAFTGLVAGAAIDGITLLAGDRVLLKNQTSAASNGIYQVFSAPSNFRRAFDMDQDTAYSVPAEEVVGAFVYVAAGGSNGGTLWRTTNTTAPVIGTTDINFAHVPFGGGTGTAAASNSATLTVSETDNVPSVGNINVLKVPTASLTDNGSGTATLALLGSKGGGRDTAQTIAASGAAQTLDLSAYNLFDITLTASCALTFTGAPPSGVGAAFTLILRQGGSGSYLVTWPAAVKWQATDGTMTGAAPTLHTAVNAQDTVVVSTVDGGTTYGGILVGSATAGTTSPLTTKGDLYTYGSNNARLAVGSNGTGVIADPTAAEGIRWTLAAIRGELLMQDGVAAPPVPVETDPTGDDWLYADL